MMKLDPKAALKYYDAALERDFKDAALRLERAKARLAAGAKEGALGDAGAAVENGGGPAALAARAEIKHALGRDADEVARDFEAAAKADPKYGDVYRAFLAKVAKEQVTEPRPGAKKPKQRALFGIAVPSLAGMAAVGLILIVAGFLLIRLAAAKNDTRPPQI